MTSRIDFVITIGGKAGQGVLSSGILLESVLHDLGLYTFSWSDYPSLIKGGHNVMMVRVSDRPVMAPSNQLGILVALDQDSILIHREELGSQSLVLYNANIVKDELSFKPTRTQRFWACGVPLADISKSIDKSQFYTNTAALGALHALLDLSPQKLEKSIKAKYGHKGKQIVTNNYQAIRRAFEYVEHEYDRPSILPSLGGVRPHTSHQILDGSHAIAYGAIRAGLRFTAAYPMTPASATFEKILALAPKYQIVAKQAEDEISAICMSIGASYAGTRAMTMTSGGGFSLMVEGIGLSGMTETPLVIMNAMRGGPSTGLPTKTEQSDLRFMVHSSHGEFPRVILAPGDAEEAFVLIQEAFNLADMYQLPVIILSDEYLANSRMAFTLDNVSEISPERGVWVKSADELGNEGYQRYFVTKDGVSPRALPGTKGLVVKVGSDEHNESSEICEDPNNRVIQMNKRMRKEVSLLPSLPKPQRYGSRTADITLISWGSTKHACIEAVDLLKQQDISANVLHFTCVYPLDEAKLLPILTKIKKAVVIENNYQAQFAGMLKQYVGFIADGHLTKYDGQPFYPDEIVRYIYKTFF